VPSAATKFVQPPGGAVPSAATMLVQPPGGAVPSAAKMFVQAPGGAVPSAARRSVDLQAAWVDLQGAYRWHLQVAWVDLQAWQQEGTSSLEALSQSVLKRFKKTILKTLVYFIMGLGYEKCEASKKAISQRAGDYLTRLQELMALIARQDSPAVPAPLAAAAPKPKGEWIGDEDGKVPSAPKMFVQPLGGVVPSTAKKLVQTPDGAVPSSATKSVQPPGGAVPSAAKNSEQPPGGAVPSAAKKFVQPPCGVCVGAPSCAQGVVPWVGPTDGRGVGEVPPLSSVGTPSSGVVMSELAVPVPTGTPVVLVPPGRATTSEGVGVSKVGLPQHPHTASTVVSAGESPAAAAVSSASGERGAQTPRSAIGAACTSGGEGALLPSTAVVSADAGGDEEDVLPHVTAGYLAGPGICHPVFLLQQKRPPFRLCAYPVPEWPASVVGVTELSTWRNRCDLAFRFDPAPQCVNPGCLKKAKFRCGSCIGCTPYCSKRCQNRGWSSHMHSCTGGGPVPSLFKGSRPPCAAHHPGHVRMSQVYCDSCQQGFCSAVCLASTDSLLFHLGSCSLHNPPAPLPLSSPPSSSHPLSVPTPLDGGVRSAQSPVPPPPDVSI
jgi:hypothetical protein